MGIAEILTIIGLGLLYGSALIMSYINIRIKIKELEMKIMGLQHDFDVNKKKVEIDISKLEDRNTTEHREIMEKVDIIIEKISEIRISQAKNNKENN
jgi:hypothetical protein